jgi:hypothetical protein
MEELRTEVEIKAPPAKVWAVLSDFAHYPEWNPFITSIKGPLAAGGQLEIRMRPPQGRATTLRPEITRIYGQRELRWKSRFLVPGLFDREHVIEIHDYGSSVLLVQSEMFTGVLTVFLRKRYERVREGLEQMNAALKRQAESTG